MKSSSLWDKIFLALKKCHWFDESSKGGCSGSWSWMNSPDDGKLNPKCKYCPKWDRIDRRKGWRSDVRIKDPSSMDRKSRST